MNQKANECIKCTVEQCKNHCDCQDYCTLDCITVGTHESNPTMNQCTDCKSFELKKRKTGGWYNPSPGFFTIPPIPAY